MQKVFCLSSLTYECTQVTPSSALPSTTDPHTETPSSEMGMSRPSGKILSTMYRAICLSLEERWGCRARRRPFDQEAGPAVMGNDHPSCLAPVPKLARGISMSQDGASTGVPRSTAMMRASRYTEGRRGDATLDRK